MKYFNILAAAFLLFSTTISAQVVECDTMGVAYDSTHIEFKESSLVTPDSAIIIPMINNTHTNFAYPQAKLVNTTPLPTGMSLFDSNWQVFASAWNIGDTMPVSIPYDVNNVIPDNYMVTFKLYVTNFAPLTIDSCVFVNTLTINLKPVAPAAVQGINGVSSPFSFYPNPATKSIQVTSALSGKSIEIYSMTGALVQTVVADHSTIIDISTLPAGLYFIKEKGTMAVLKLVKV